MKANLFTRGLLASVTAVALLATSKQGSLAQRSLVRAVMLEKNTTGYSVGILYQDVAAAADAAQAGEQLRLSTATADSLDSAFFAAEQKLTQTADYKLCDYVLLCKCPSLESLQHYLELLIARNTNGRLAAYLYAVDQSIDDFKNNTSEKESILSEWLDTLQANRKICPRVYNAHADAIIIPQLIFSTETVPAHTSGALLLNKNSVTLSLDENCAQMLFLLQQRGNEHTVLLQGREVHLTEYCIDYSVSPSGVVEYTVNTGADSTLSPSEIQTQLNVLANEAVQACGADVLELIESHSIAQLAGKPQASAVTIQFRIFSAY